MYTQRAPLKCKVFTRLCSMQLCELLWDEGESECIHVSTLFTCAGDEIGWSFVNKVRLSGTTFTAFCEEQNHNYQARSITSRKFMSPAVFIHWWFGWASNQRIDFRQPCSVCKFEPPYLACDATKIGVRINIVDVEPIEKVDDSTVILPSPSNRNSRCFLQYTDDIDDQETRNMRDRMSELSDPSLVPNVSDYNNMLGQIPPAIIESLNRLINGTMDKQEKTAYCNLLDILCGTTPLLAVIPGRYLEEFQQLLQIINLESQDIHPVIADSLDRMRAYSPEIRELILASKKVHDNTVPNDILELLQYIATRIEDFLTTVTPSEPAQPQPGSYNPPKYGRAYYFNASGSRIRHVRSFAADGRTRSKKNYDDDPMPSESCSKDFPDPRASARGTCYSFFWFCPQHHHCYGFHLIPGSEGRKDPHASLYTHLDKPPRSIFYDFGCGYHEYSLNRESEYYKYVQFFHDIFHGYSHKCSCVYRSSRLSGFERVNSSICEQFNAFMQCIKTSARQMSQTRFMFYMQYFIHIWNERKSERYARLLQVAHSCME